MLTEFDRKRLQYFIKAAERGDWTQLGKGDIKIFSIVEELHKKKEECDKLANKICEMQMELGQYQILVDKPE